MPGPVSQLTPVAAPRNHMPYLESSIGKMRFSDIKNVPSPVHCQLPHTKGDHERTSHADAKAVAVEVMKAGLKSASRSDAAALNRAISLLSPHCGDKAGHILQMNLTALGAIRAAVALLQQESAHSPSFDRLLAKLDVSISQIGIAAGKCRGMPEAVITDKTSEKLSDAVEVGKALMVKCVSEVGGQQLLSAISRSVLLGAMKDSIATRLPHLLEQFEKSDGAPDLMQVLQSEAATKLDGVLRRQMETGGAEAITSAILNLLKAPEYVKQGDPGQAGNTPEAPVRDNGPGIPPELMRAGTGAPVLYNNNQAAPITINNAASHTFSPTDIRNLVNDSFDRGYSLGLSHGEHAQLRADNTALRKQNADLMELLRKNNERLNLYAKGTDIVRVPVGTSEDEVDTTVQQRNTAPPSDDQNPRTRLDPDSPRAPRVPSENRQRNQLDQTNQNRQTTEQRSEQLLNRGGNGDGGPRNPRQDDHADSRNRLGGTQQLDQRQRTEQNRDLQRIDSSNRSGSAGGNDVDFDYRELSYYLQAAGFEKKTLPVDLHEPTSIRNKKGPNTVRASDVKQYVKERSENAGKPFVPPHTGTLNPPLPASPGRFNELVQAFGRENIIPSLVAGAENTKRRSGSAPAPVPKKSDLQEGMEAFFRNSRLKFLGRAQRDPVPSSAIPIRIPALPRASVATPASADRGLLGRSDSVSSIASNGSEDGFEFGERIIAASRQSQPTLAPRGAHLPLRASAGAATPLAQLARSIPSAPSIDSAPRTRPGSLSVQGLANGQRQDDLRRSMLDAARKPDGGDERKIAFNAPQDPLAGINVDEILESIRDEERLQADVAPLVLHAAPPAPRYKTFQEEWDALSSSPSSPASSVMGEEPEVFDDVVDFEPERDNMVVHRSYSAISMDSGRGSPPLPTEQVSWEPQSADRVADRVAVDPKANDIGKQRAMLIEELSGRLKKKVS